MDFLLNNEILEKKKGFKYLAVALFLLLEREHINLASSEEMLWENEVSDA